jgi:diketogulonate reductase-like aldo/keto reductase
MYPGAPASPGSNATGRDLAARHDRTPGQIALRWLIQREVLPIPGGEDRTAGRRQRLGIVLPPSEAEMDALDTASN